MGSTSTTGNTRALDDSGGTSSSSGSTPDGSTTDGSTSGSTDGSITDGSTTNGSTGGSTTADVATTDPGATSNDDGLVCTAEYHAVCGKDGETYDHPCSAIAAGVEIRHDGPCFGDCEGSCVVAPQGPSLLALVLVVLAFVRPRRRADGP